MSFVWSATFCWHFESVFYATWLIIIKKMCQNWGIHHIFCLFYEAIQANSILCPFSVFCAEEKTKRLVFDNDIETTPSCATQSYHRKIINDKQWWSACQSWHWYEFCFYLSGKSTGNTLTLTSSGYLMRDIWLYKTSPICCGNGFAKSKIACLSRSFLFISMTAHSPGIYL